MQGEDHGRIQRLREELPATVRAYFNAGTCGPIPRAAVHAARAWMDLELEQGRIDQAARERTLEVRERVRQRLARLIGAGPGEVALTHSTSDAINLVVGALEWRRGDEVVISNLEHPGVLYPVLALRQRYGVVVRVADLGRGERDAGEAVRAVFSARTRLVAFSHVAYGTGARFDLEGVVSLAHEHGVPVLLDGAQAVGAIPVDVQATGADFYALPAQKWLLGPEGLGALYVRRERLADLGLGPVGYLSVRQADPTGFLLPQPDARRFEVGMLNGPALTALDVSLAWLDEEVGWSWVYDRVAELAGFAARCLAAVPGVRVLTPTNRAGLVTFTVPGDTMNWVARLAEKEILLRAVPEPQALRIATGFYNTEEEIEGLASALTAGEG